MYFRLGNLSPRRFAEIVKAEFTETELAYLESVWSQKAELTGPDDFHIFEAPRISITVGAHPTETTSILIAANARKAFNRLVNIDLDEAWKKAS